MKTPVNITVMRLPEFFTYNYVISASIFATRKAFGDKRFRQKGQRNAKIFVNSQPKAKNRQTKWKIIRTIILFHL